METPAHPPEHPAADDVRAPGVADPAQESLVSALRASFNVLRVVMIVLVLLYVWSGVFVVGSGEQGLVARLGELQMRRTERAQTPVYLPGWYWALPEPFDRHYTLTGKTLALRSTTFMFEHADAGSTEDLTKILPVLPDLTPGQQGAMLTGDKNLSHGRWEVQYVIRDAAAFVRNIGDQENDFVPLLMRLLDSAVVREVSGRTVEEVMREQSNFVVDGVKRRLQEALDRLNTGVEAVNVTARTIEPGSVRPAFLDVSRALSERQTARERAREQATEIINRAAGTRDMHDELMTLITAYGEAQLAGVPEKDLIALRLQIDVHLAAAETAGAGQISVKLSEARAEANAINERVRQEYTDFMQYLALREAQPRLAPLDLWVRMRQKVLATRQNEIFFVPDSNQIEILVNRDPQRQIELEEQRALERAQGGPPAAGRSP